MKNISTICIIWINFSFTVPAVGSVPGRNLAQDISGDKIIEGESSLIFDANSVSEKSKSYDNNDNSNIINTISISHLSNSNSLTTNPTEITQKYDNDVISDTDLDVESSDIWKEYEEYWNDNIAVIPTSNPHSHFHYEVVTTSSKSNLCRVQCVAICDTNPVRTFCSFFVQSMDAFINYEIAIVIKVSVCMYILFSIQLNYNEVFLFN